MHEFNAVGVDIFAGGFTLGVQEHFNVLAHLEENNYGVRSFKGNFPHVPVKIGAENWRPFVDELKRFHDLDFMYANPPCATFSVAGSVMKGGVNAWRTDPRLHCWTRCFNIAMYARPRVYMCESVTRAFTAGREFMDGLAERANREGYAVTHLMVDGKWHGLPQKRKRYFFVAHDVGLRFPAPNWAPPKTVGEALKEVSHPGVVNVAKDDLQLELIPKLKQGEQLRRLWEEEKTRREGPEENWERNSAGVKGRPRMFVHRLKADEPMGTITGDYFIHPFEDRYLGSNELKVLNGMPEDYWFEGNPKASGSLIARGVCPPVAEYVARAARSAIEAMQPVEATVQVVDYQKPPKELQLN